MGVKTVYVFCKRCKPHSFFINRVAFALIPAFQAKGACPFFYGHGLCIIFPRPTRPIFIEANGKSASLFLFNPLFALGAQ
jgi:hypothetical protein